MLMRGDIAPFGSPLPVPYINIIRQPNLKCCLALKTNVELKVAAYKQNQLYIVNFIYSTYFFHTS